MFTQKELNILSDCLLNELKELNETRNRHSDSNFKQSFIEYIKQVQDLHSKICMQLGKDLIKVS